MSSHLLSKGPKPPLFRDVVYHIDDRLSPTTREHIAALLDANGATSSLPDRSNAQKEEEDGTQSGAVPSSAPVSEDVGQFARTTTEKPLDPEHGDVNQMEVDDENVGGGTGSRIPHELVSELPVTSSSDWSRVTHVITETMDWSQAKAELKNLERLELVKWITPSWVERSVKMSTIQEPSRYSPDPRHIFSGITIFCSSEIPPADREVMYGLISALGGQSRAVPTKDTTHILTTQVVSSNFDQVRQAALGIKFVLPLWFQNCLQTHRCLPVAPYEFKSADELPLVQRTEFRSAISEGEREKLLLESMQVQEDDTSESKMARIQGFKAVAMASLVEEKYKPIYPFSTSSEEEGQEDRKLQQYMQGKKIYLSSQLALNQETENMLANWIVAAGGVIVDKVDEECDVLLTRLRAGPDYFKAIRLGKTVASLAWLYHVFRIGHLTSPKDDLLHYPVPADPIPHFDKLQISLTNYTGDGRDYLKRLITTMGGKFTTTLAPSNSHLVAATKLGDKAIKAEQWGIPVLNHFWLEDCFKAWKLIPSANDRYVHYPLGVNHMNLLCGVSLSDLDLKPWTDEAFKTISTTQLEEASVERGLEGVEDEQMEADQRGVGDNDAMTEEEEEAAVADADANGHQTREQGDQNRKQDIDDEPEQDIKPRISQSRSRSITIDDTNNRAPSTQKRRARPPARESSAPQPDIDLDNIVATGSKRGAARVATQKLHEQGADMIKYAKEKKRKDPISPKSRAAARLPSSPVVKREQEIASIDDDDEDEEDEEDLKTKPAKRARGRSKSAGMGTSGSRLGKRPLVAESVEQDDKSEDENMEMEMVDPKKIKYLTTGVNLSEADLKKFKRFGVKEVKTPSQCTHLICAPVLQRTPKLIEAMPGGAMIVSEDWVRACLDASKLLAPDEYQVYDPAFEKKYDCNLRQACARAKVEKKRGGLLKGKSFYFTPSVKPDIDGMLKFIKAAGGKSAQLYNTKYLTSLVEEKDDDCNYVIGDPADEKLWKPLKAKGVPVYDKDFLLTGILRMRLKPEENIL